MAGYKDPSVIRKETVDGDLILELHIPRHKMLGLSRRAFADMVYDMMVKPYDLLADPLVQSYSRERVFDIETPIEAPPVVDTNFPNIPTGWRVFWCTQCNYSATFDDDAANSYGDDWPGVVEDASSHEHIEVNTNG